MLDTLFRRSVLCRRVRSVVIDWRIRFWGAVARWAGRRHWIALVDNCIDYDLEPLWPETHGRGVPKGVLKDQLRDMRSPTCPI